jgi:long-chain acyl-CoA synthetase
VTVLLGTRQQKPEIAYVLTDCGAACLIHEASLAERVPDAQDVPELRHRIVMDDDPQRSTFSELSDHPPLLEAAEVGEEDTAMILYTSGTTGRPKGAMLAHCNIIHSSMVFASSMELTSRDRSVAAVPLAHVTGSVANITTMTACAGVLIIAAEFKAADYLKLAARERVTYTLLVPAMYNLCLLQPDFDSYDLSSWRIGGFGGAPMPIATIERLAQKNPRPQADELLRRDRDHLAVDDHAGRLDCQLYRQRRSALSGRDHHCGRCRGQGAAARRDRRALDPLCLRHQGLLEQSESDRRKLYRRLLAFR